MAKEYILIQGLSALVFILGGAVLWLKRQKRMEHNCKTCRHCMMVRKASNGKMFYKCGNIYVGDAGFYEEDFPIYCGKWSKRRGIM